MLAKWPRRRAKKEVTLPPESSLCFESQCFFGLTSDERWKVCGNVQRLSKHRWMRHRFEMLFVFRMSFDNCSTPEVVSNKSRRVVELSKKKWQLWICGIWKEKKNFGRESQANLVDQSQTSEGLVGKVVRKCILGIASAKQERWRQKDVGQTWCEKETGRLNEPDRVKQSWKCNRTPTPVVSGETVILRLQNGKVEQNAFGESYEARLS